MGRRGIGTLLLETVRAFYAHHGFEVVATDDGSGTEEGLPDVTCRWTPSR